jgi:hypothetical protein
VPDPTVSGSGPLVPLKAALLALSAWLSKDRVKGVVIGGVAASILGRPRTTGDVDLLVWLEEPEWDRFLSASRSHGFEPRIKDALSFARRARVLFLRHRPSGIEVDVSLGALPFERQVIERSGKVDLAGISVPLPTPEDLVVMKAVAHRPRDGADIEGILEANPALDRDRVKGWVKEFAAALEAPEILKDLESILARVPPGKPGGKA